MSFSPLNCLDRLKYKFVERNAGLVADDSHDAGGLCLVDTLEDNGGGAAGAGAGAGAAGAAADCCSFPASAVTAREMMTMMPQSTASIRKTMKKPDTAIMSASRTPRGSCTIAYFTSLNE